MRIPEETEQIVHPPPPVEDLTTSSYTSYDPNSRDDSKDTYFISKDQVRFLPFIFYLFINLFI